MSHPLKVQLHVSGRAKPHSLMYFRLCAESLVRYRGLSASLAKLQQSDDRYDSLMLCVEDASVQPVIFAGMCLEATLYDLAACLYGEEFAQRTERLNPLRKFVVLAQCVDQNVPSKGHTTYQYIQALVTARNRLVHYKSQPLPEENLEQFMEQAERTHQGDMAGIDASFKTLVFLSLYFDGNIFEELCILPSFKEPRLWQSVVPRELHVDVHRCIEVAAKTRQSSLGNTVP